MVALAETTDDLSSTCTDEVALHTLLCRRLGLGLFVAGTELQHDALADSSGRPIRTWLVALLLAKFSPCFALRNGVVYDLLLQRALDFACNLRCANVEGQINFVEIAVHDSAHLDFLALVVNCILHRCTDPVLINIILAFGLFWKGKRLASHSPA